MSKRYGIWDTRFSLSATVEWCKRTAGRYWKSVCGIVGSITNGRRNDQFEIARLTNVRVPVQVDFCGKRIELKEFIKILRIGDRVRVLCDDGVLVAEKISQTQFKLIHAQMMPKSVH